MKCHFMAVNSLEIYLCFIVISLVSVGITYYNSTEKQIRWGMKSMRVIAGSARRLQLKTIEGMDTRPTTDRIKETLFNMLQHDLYGCRFLDLFSGSGAIGIEALSRGAGKAVFVEKNPKAVVCIRDNLRTTHLEEKAEVLTCDVLSALSRLEGTCPAFDYIFMDPPYDQQWERAVLQYLSGSSLAGPETMMIVEASRETECSWISQFGMTLQKEKVYKTNKHLFITKGEKENEGSYLSGQL